MFFVFLITFTLIVYHYLLFPLWIFVRSKRPEVATRSVTPSITLVIAAYNESKVIAEKVKNSFQLEYPSLEVLVVADGSTDDTAEVALKTDERVKVLYDGPRRGKSAALNRGVEVATGDVVVFSDANTYIEPSALRKLVAHFSDIAVGGVCGRKEIAKSDARESTKGDSTFWSFESRLKTAQSHLGSISVADGELFAIRRSLFQPIAVDIINDDAEITLSLVRRGYRVLYEPEAITVEEASLKLEDDFKVKARMVYGGYQTILNHRDFLFPPKKFFAVQFLSHKFLRYFMPNLLLMLYVSSFFVATTGEYPWVAALFLCQTVFYGAALVAYIRKTREHSLGVLYYPYYYCLMNGAAWLGLYYFLTRKNTVAIWQKAAR